MSSGGGQVGGTERGFDDEMWPVSAFRNSLFSPFLAPTYGETVSGKQGHCLVFEVQRQQERRGPGVGWWPWHRDLSRRADMGPRTTGLGAQGQRVSQSSALGPSLAPWAFRAPLRSRKHRNFAYRCRSEVISGWRSVTSGERRSRPALADSGPDRLWKVSLIHTHPRPLPFEGSCSARLPCPPLWAPESWPVPEMGALTSQAHSRFPERGTGRRQACEGQDWHLLCAAPICLPAQEALSSPPPNSATAWVCSRLFGSVSVTCVRQSVLLDGLLLESRDLSFRCQFWNDDCVSGGPGPAGCGTLPRWCRGPPS